MKDGFEVLPLSWVLRVEQVDQLGTQTANSSMNPYTTMHAKKATGSYLGAERLINELLGGLRMSTRKRSIQVPNKGCYSSQTAFYLCFNLC